MLRDTYGLAWFKVAGVSDLGLRVEASRNSEPGSRFSVWNGLGYNV